jgi:hypothetical protein
MLLFTTGTFTEASAAALGTTMQSKLRDDLVLHPAWELVEEFTPASGLVNWVVMKCLASVSGLEQDYFVVIGRIIANGRLQIFFCESYNSGTKVCAYYPPYYAGPTFTYDSLGRAPHTYTLSTAAIVESGGSVTAPYVTRNWTPGAVTTKFWIIVADDGLTVAWNGTPNHFIHISAYIPLAALKSDLPIVMGGLTTGGSGPDGGVARNPAVAGMVGGRAGGLSSYSGGSPFTVYTPIVGLNYGFPLVNDKLNDNKRLIHEVGIAINPNPQAEVPIYGWFLGKQKPRYRVSSELLPATLWGDTFTINGTLWVSYTTGQDFRVWDTGVVA